MSLLHDVKNNQELNGFVNEHRLALDEAGFDALEALARSGDDSAQRPSNPQTSSSKNPLSPPPGTPLLNKLAACRVVLASSAYSESNYDLAIHHYRQALKLVETQNQPKFQGALRRDLGSILQKGGGFDEALVEWQRAAETFWACNDDQRAHEISNMVHQACWETGKLELALAFAEKAARHYEEKENFIEACGEQNNLGFVLGSMGRVEEAIQEFNQALVFAGKLNDGRVEERNTLGNLARAYAVSGQYEEAMKLYQQILKISAGAALQDRRMRMLASRNLGLTLRELGQPFEALQEFQEALDLLKNLDDEDRKGKNRLLSSIGIAQRDKGDIKLAELSYRAALQEAQAVGDSAGESDAWGHLGNYYYETGKFAEAETHYRKALELTKATGDSVFICRWTGNLANTLCRLAAKATKARARAQMLAEAETLYHEALALSQKIGDVNHEYLWNYNLGSFRWHVRGDLQNAYLHYREAIRCLELLRGQIKQDDFTRSFGESKVFVYHDMVNLCLLLPEHRHEAIDYVERGKGYTLMRMMERGAPEVSDELRLRYQEVRLRIQTLRHRLAASAADKQVPMSPSKALQQQTKQRLDEAEKEQARILQEIASLDPDFVKTVCPDTIEIKDIQATLRQLQDKETVLVEFFVTAEQTNVFLVWKDGFEVMEFPGFTEKDLLDWHEAYISLKRKLEAQDYGQWKAIVLAWDAFYSEMSMAFASKFWDRVQKKLDGIKADRLVLAPHSALHLFPLHLIPISRSSSGSPQYLIDQYEVMYSPSFRMLWMSLNKKRSAPRRDHFLAVSNPDESLAFADFEVEQIARLFDEPRILQHDAATCEAVLAESAAAHFLHFATHGAQKRLADGSEAVALVLTNGKRLSPQDIFSQMKIRQSYAVVLSACETGVVKLDQGDEYVGLPAAFLYAGAPAVVSSLWKVDDISTALLMIEWYANIRTKGMGRAEALKQAQLRLREMRVSEARPQILRCLHAAKTKLEKQLAEASAQQEKSVGEKALECYRQQIHAYEQAEGTQAVFPNPYYWGAFVISGNPE